MAVEVFRAINLPLRHVSELASPPLPLTAHHPHPPPPPSIHLALPLCKLGPVASWGAVWRLRGWRLRREQL